MGWWKNVLRADGSIHTLTKVTMVFFTYYTVTAEWTLTMPRAAGLCGQTRARQWLLCNIIPCKNVGNSKKSWDYVSISVKNDFKHASNYRHQLTPNTNLTHTCINAHKNKTKCQFTLCVFFLFMNFWALVQSTFFVTKYHDITFSQM